jgi:ubiquinone/menaquinone biosynthesis C-methylase UbiE
MHDTAKGQVDQAAAEFYDEYFVPALFQEWTDPVADAAGVRPGQRVLDVACGTGVLARHLAERVGAKGSVVGLDPNPGMLAVARRKAPTLEWREAPAEAIPLGDGLFHAALSQFGLMFFDDRVKAIREMMRVTKRRGHVAVAVWDAIDRSPGYAKLASLLERLFGADAAAAVRTPYALGDVKALAALFEKAGVPNATIETHEGTARFNSIRWWMKTDVRGWTLSDMIDDAQFERLAFEAEEELKEFTTPHGNVVFPTSAHIVSAVKG